ncbi:MAG: hypothetical protein ACFFHV_07285 [Promethearchaeota archaeon]
MRKKDKKSKRKSQEEEQRSESFMIKDYKIKLLSKVDELKFNAQKSWMEGNLDDAIYNAEQIIRLAIMADMPSYIKEQEEFINLIAKEVQKDYLISEIQKTSKSLHEMYDTLVASNQASQAHEIVKSFVKRYQDMPFFNSIPSVKDLITKDKRVWIEHISSLQNER